MACHANSMTPSRSTFIAIPIGMAQDYKQLGGLAPVISQEPPLVIETVGPSTSRSTSMIRFVHNIADGPEFDIYLTDKMVASEIPYGTISDYIFVTSGDYDIRMTGVDSRIAILSGKVSLAPNEKYTVLATGLPRDPRYPLGLFLIRDERSCPTEGKAFLRFVHASAGCPNLDFYANETKVFSNVPFGRAGTPVYVSVDAGVIEMNLTLAGTQKVVLGPVPLILKPKHVYTVFTTGIPGDNESPFGILVSNDAKHFCLHI